MKNILRKKDRNRPGNGGEFTEHDHTAPQDTLTAVVSFENIALPEPVKTASVAAAAGGHNALFLVDDATEDATEQLVYAMAAAQGKHVVVVDGLAQPTAAEVLGTADKAGKVTEAHGGILYIKNAPDLSASILDGLRQPLDAGVLQITRADRQVTRDADFQLVLAAKTSPCGQPTEWCRCTPEQKRRYHARLSGPLLDRTDVQANVSRPTTGTRPGRVTTDDARAKIERAQERQAQRYGYEHIDWDSNAHAPGSYLRSPERRLPKETTAILDRSLERGGITMRGYDRALRMAWTMADMDGADQPTVEHIESALNVRKALR